MIAKCLLILLTLNVLTGPDVMAQQSITLSGIVADNTDEETLIGVSINDAQRRSLGVTDLNGRFRITVPAGTSVSFSMIGYTTVSRVFNATDNNLSIRLTRSDNALNEVVVTALGIKREQKALGFATQTLKD
jgi:hypothetical protein